VLGQLRLVELQLPVHPKSPRRLQRDLLWPSLLLVVRWQLLPAPEVHLEVLPLQVLQLLLERAPPLLLLLAQLVEKQPPVQALWQQAVTKLQVRVLESRAPQRPARVLQARLQQLGLEPQLQVLGQKL